VPGIGCHTAFAALMDVDCQQAMRGRAPAQATRLKRVVPDLLAFTLQVARETQFLTLEELVELHRQLIVRFGGGGGVRDAGLVESALARPRSGTLRRFRSKPQRSCRALRGTVHSSTATSGSRSRRPPCSSA
jgi:hypothetical protein